MVTDQSTVRPSARERLLTAANELFYAEGVRSVGIDRIIEHAGVAKASLYNTFGGKEQLVQAYLERRHENISARITRAVDSYDAPRDRLLAVFEAQSATFGDPDYHGCAFISASAEAVPGGLVEQASDNYRGWLRGLFTRLAEQAGAADPEALGRQLQFIYDGATIAVRMDHNVAAGETSRAMAIALIDAAVAGAGR
jgi:AcrR family transcriptional regulator